MNNGKDFDLKRTRRVSVLVAVTAIFGGMLGGSTAVFAQANPPSTPSQDAGSGAKKAEQAPAAPSAASIEKGKALVLAAAKAAGGDALKAIHNMQVDTTGQAFAQGQTVDVQLELTIEYPNHLHTQVQSSQGNLQQAFDGTNGWIVTDQGVIDLPEEYVPEFKRGIALAGAWGMYRDAMDGKIDAHSVDEEQVDGHKVEIVEWASTSGPVKLYFDAGSHLLTGAHFEAVTPAGPVQADQRWSDFKTVSGCQYPYHNTVFHNGQKFTETDVKSIKTNITIDPAYFSKPQTPPAK